MLLVHGFAGGLTTYYTLKNNKNLKFSSKYLNFIWFLGITGAIFPDLDIVFVFLNEDIEHRRLLTHSLLPYLLLFILVNLIVYFIRINKDKKNLLLISNLVFFMGVCSHLFIDFFVGGLSLLNPFTNYYFGYMLPFADKDPDWQFKYFASPYMVVETIIALWFFEIRKYINSFVGKYLPIFLFFVAMTATIILMSK